MSDVSITAAGFAAAGWLWDKYGKDIIDKASEGLAKRWLKVKWPEAEARYRARMKELYGYTRLLGNPKRIEIEEIYTDVYVLDKPTAFYRFDLEELQKRPLEREALRTEKERKPILRLAVNEQRLFLLGKPGAGKTTFLKYLTLQACAGKISKTPIFVSLKEWVDSGIELMPFLEQQFEICEFPEVGLFIEYLLKEGAALVMFDGLDEVSAEDERRAKVIQALTRFAKKYSKAQICVTCRVAATDYSFTEFTYLEIADFNETQQRLFAEKWYQGEPEKLKLFLTEFEKPENKGLQELAQTPLLLALLCLSFDETLAFPPRRVDLYKEALDALLKKWDSTRGISHERRDEMQMYRKIPLKHKRGLLANVAYNNFNNNAYFFREDALINQIENYLQSLSNIEIPDGDVILKAIEAQHGILVERARGIYSFSHLTFQEYFTAQYIVDTETLGTISTLVQHQLNMDRWREVILLVASMLDNADGFFELFLKEFRKWPEEYPWLMDWFDWMKVQSDKCKSTHPKAVVLLILLTIRIFIEINNMTIAATNRLYNAFEVAFNLTCNIDHNINQKIGFIRDLDHVSNGDYIKAHGFRNIRDFDYSIVDFFENYLDLQLDEEYNLEEIITEDQSITLIEYMGNLWLLFNCLELASVTDRESIQIAAAGCGVI